ncbi:leucine-rich repeat domain-containing protein [Abyssalbus ytuae]|uniref:Leucine-rich repeat domain-containing protein n=1 Tax=Abyssalbus ytuae TaxID=2926907 RepID=A0A9E6ZV93_9FLAO|nr:leucine-rich repeat domain-containing protein [Abyssalbus ytuae]UOB18418.1 leucine-rich repeat domain-containing protein [Abyssalbus ytuae]
MKNLFKFLTFIFLVFAGCSKDIDAELPYANTGKILAFSFQAKDNFALNDNIVATIDEETKNITATVPFGTERTSLLPLVEVSQGVTYSPAGAVDFTNPVTYTLITVSKKVINYKVSVKEADSNASDAKKIIGFVFRAADNNEALEEDVTAEIEEENKIITATVPFGTELASLLPEVEVSEKATVSPTGAQDFTNEVDYVVTAENGTTATYKVSVKEADPGTGKQILSFVFKATDNAVLNGEDVAAKIDQDNHTIIADILASIDATALTPSIEVSEGATVSSSGPQECSNEVIYTVTAQDATQATYTFTFNFTATTQKEVLMAIYKSNPCNTLGWDFNEDISDWTGVTVDDSEDNIIGLSLPSRKLTNLPAGIGQLTSLEDLILGNNQLTELPAEIGQLTLLEILYIGENELTGLPAEIGQLESLKELDLSGNQLTGLPEEIGQLASLEYLNLNKNQLTGLPAEIDQLTLLEILELKENLLTGLPTEIGQLESLKELLLSGNQLTSIPEQIGNLTDLTHLGLYDNKLEGVPVQIGNLINLTHLDLGKNLLTSIPAEIGNLESLEILYLDDNDQLTSIPQEVCDLEEDQETTINKDDGAICEGSEDD